MLLHGSSSVGFRFASCYLRGIKLLISATLTNDVSKKETGLMCSATDVFRSFDYSAPSYASRGVLTTWPEPDKTDENHRSFNKAKTGIEVVILEPDHSKI